MCTATSLRSWRTLASHLVLHKINSTSTFWKSPSHSQYQRQWRLFYRSHRSTFTPLISLLIAATCSVRMHIVVHTHAMRTGPGRYYSDLRYLWDFEKKIIEKRSGVKKKTRFGCVGVDFLTRSHPTVVKTSLFWVFGVFFFVDIFPPFWR